MSADVNVYSTRAEPLPIDAVLNGLRQRGIDPTWQKDDFFGEGDGGSWDAGALESAGQRVDLSWQKLLPGELDGVDVQAAALGPDAAALVPEVALSYRLHAREPNELLWAVATVLVELAPGLAIDVNSNTVYDRGRLAARGPSTG